MGNTKPKGKFRFENLIFLEEKRERMAIIRLVLVISILMLVVQPAMALSFDKAEVSYCNNSIKIEVHYTLDTISAIKVFFFGAGIIEDDVKSFFSTDNYTIEKIDFNHAEFLFPIEKGNCVHFNGVNLTKPVQVVLKIGSEVDIGITDRIPQIYFCPRSAY